MYRIAFSIILFCTVSAFCVQELVGQPSEGRRRRSETPPPPAQPAGEQPAPDAEQPAPNAEPTAEGNVPVPDAPAEPPKPDTPQTDAYIPPPSPPPNSLTQLTSPYVAERLGLDDKQRNEVYRLVNLQTLALAQAAGEKAPAERYLEIYKETEDKLRNLLTATQQAVLAQGLEAKTIKFNFRNQAWIHVLQLIAEQGGYQLVLDAPPPGTFSFSSPEEFTIIEALDIINGNLITRGYTLTRRDNRMLQLLNLRHPIPNWSFPSAKPEELQGRASSEYVSVIFPLERRDREKVIQGIQPLKNDYTRVSPVGGNELLVIDRVEMQNAVQRVINSVENPPAPQPPQQPPQPEPPKWEKYTVEKNEPMKIEEIFKEYVPDAKVIRLAHSQELHVFARPDQQAQLGEILKMLEEDAGAGRTDSKLVSYQISNYVEAQGLRQGGPQGRGGWGRNFDTSTLPSWVDPAQFFQMNQMQRFGVELIAMLKASFPKATISEAPIGDKIVVLATESEHEEINNFLEGMRPTEESRLVAHLYQFAEKGKKMNAETERQIQSLLPNARTTLDTERGLILVIAAVKEHEELKKMVKELEEATPSTEDRVLQSYQLSASTIETFWSLVNQLSALNQLRSYIPIRDSQRNQYLIWATPKQHVLIEKIYQDVTGQTQQTGGAPADAVVICSPKNITIETLQTVITDIYPTAKITVDAPRKQVIIRVRPDQKEPLQLLLDQLDAADPDEEQRYFDAYAIEAGFYSITSGYDPGRPQQLVEQLVKVAPDAKINWDAPSQKLIVWGTKEEHAKIKAAIQNLLGDGKDKILDRIQLRRKDAWEVLPTLHRMFPSVLFTPDNTGRVLIVEGHSKLLPKVVDLLDIIDPEELSENDPVVRFYKFEKEPTDLLLQGLRQLAPAANIMQDRGNRQIMVIARPADHKIIETNTDDIVATFAVPEKEIRRFQLRRVPARVMEPIIQRKFGAEVEIIRDYEMRGMLIVETDPILLTKVAELIELLDPEKPSENDPVVMYYSLKVHPSYYILEGLRELAPTAQISVAWDMYWNQAEFGRIMVIAPPAEQEIIKKNAELIAASFVEPEKKVMRFECNRMFYWDIAGIVNRMYPSSTVSYDEQGRYVVVEAYPELMPKITALVETIDPKEPAEDDPIVKFYPIRPEQSVLEGIQRMTPHAALIPDHKQILVIARPSDHKIIEANTKSIAETFTALEDPVVCIYTVTNDVRNRLTSFITETAVNDFRDAKIIPGGGDESSTAPSDQMYIWARPTEHELIATVLKQFKEGLANTPERQFKSFPMSVGDLETAQNILQSAHPDAKLFPDATGNRLMVWATAEDMEKVTRTLRIQGSIDDREMVAYPVAIEPDTIKTIIEGIYRGLKIELDAQSRKVFVWASPEEHVRIAEIVEEANKEVDPESELAESFKAYSAANLDPAMVMRLFQTIIPESSVYALPGDDKIVVKAIARDHQKIKELFEQLREKDERFRIHLTVYSFGDTDPVMIEALLYNQLPEAESMSPDDLVRRLGWWYYYQRMPSGYFNWGWGGDNQMSSTKARKFGYYKVDPQTRSAYVFVTTEQHKEIKMAMEQLVAVGNQADVKLSIRRYSLDDVDDFWYLRPLFQQVVPSANMQYIMQRFESPGWGWYYDSIGDFIAYATESDHGRIEELVREINDKTMDSKKEMLALTLPEKSPYSRERVIETVQRIHPKVTLLPGGVMNQILVWAPKNKLEQIKKSFEDIFQPLPEGERTIVKTYPLLHISTDSATTWLSALYPNAAFDPEKLTTAVQMPGLPQPQDFQRPDEGKFIVVVATPLEQVEIEKTIKELDKDLPDSHKRVQRTYLLEDVPAELYWVFYASLEQAFPNAACVPMSDYGSAMVVATEDEHKKIADFVKTYRDDSERRHPVIAIYHLKRLNAGHVFELFHDIVPSAYMTRGLTPEQILVRATPKDQRDIAQALAVMESATEIDPQHRLHVYKVGTDRAYLAYNLISGVFPQTIVFPLGRHEIIAWTSPAVHDVIETMLKDIADAYPESVLRPYFFKHIPLGEAADTINRLFVGQIAMYHRPTTDDLLVFALPDVHDRIAACIANFDIPRPAETERVPKSYDLADLPLGQLEVARSRIEQEFGERARVMYGATRGQLIIHAKPADQEKVALLVAQIIADAPGATRIMRPYTLNHGHAHDLFHMMLSELVPHVQHFVGTTPNQVLIFGRESDHVKIADLVDKLNKADPDITMHVYKTGIERAPTALNLIQRQFPYMVVQLANQSEIVAWVTSAQHETITEMLKAFVEAYPERVMRTYSLKHVLLYEAASLLQQTFSGQATIYPHPTTDDLMVHAAPNVHEQITAAIAEFDIPRPAETERLPKTYDLSELAPWQFNSVSSQLQQEYASRIRVMYSPIPGQLIVYAKQADHEKIEPVIQEILADAPAAKIKVREYIVNRGNAMSLLSPMIAQITPNAVPYLGSTPNQILVGAKESDHTKIEEAVAKLNNSETDVTLQVYWTGTQRATTAQALLQQQFPGLLTYLANPSELVAWVSPTEHEEITAMMETFAEAYPERIMKPYFFKHIPWQQGMAILTDGFYNLAAITPNWETGDLMVYARPEVHRQIAACVAEFDIPRPAGTEATSRAYDLSALSSGWFTHVFSFIPSAFSGRVVPMYGSAPGQLVVWGKPADLDKIDQLVDDILAEHPATTVNMEVYTFQRGTNRQTVSNALPYIAPNASLSFATNPNQALVWAKPDDHLKIKLMVDTLNESDPDIQVMLHPLRNISYLVANSVLNSLKSERGYDIRNFYDSYGDQFIVLARPEDQKMVSEVLDSLRAEERKLLSVALEYLAPNEAQDAVEMLFTDYSYYVRPMVKIDEYTNRLNIFGTPKELEQVAEALRNMGEDVWYPEKPESKRRTSGAGASGGNYQRGNIRTLDIRGNAELFKELEKRWKQSQPNQLKIINTKEDETPSQYSVEDEIQRETPQGTPEKEEATESIDAPGLPSVYVVAKEDGSMMIASDDAAALDRLESLINIINTGIVYEGRDYTIYSVRNISAQVVYGRLLLPLRDKLYPQQSRFAGTGRATQLYIEPDITANTLIVWGSKADRLEVGKLIATFDVSELPGEKMVRKPISVPIENTEASRVWNDVMKVYQSKLRMTQLPGGLTPQIYVNNTSNSLEVFAPEPLATELKEYIEEVDRRAVAEGGRKIHVIPLGVNGLVVQNAIRVMEQGDMMRYQQMMMRQMMLRNQQNQNMIYPGMPNRGMW